MLTGRVLGIILVIMLKLIILTAIHQRRPVQIIAENEPFEQLRSTNSRSTTHVHQDTAVLGAVARGGDQGGHFS